MLHKDIAAWIKETILDYKHRPDFGDTELITLLAATWYNYDEKTASYAYTLWQEGSYEH